MGDSLQETNFNLRLAEERPRLVRLCAWLTGDALAAEDLAQETLLAAWKNQGQLSTPEKLKPWLSAIARNACLQWSRKQQREQARRVQPPDWGEDSQAKVEEETLSDEASLELDLDQTELACLLDRALALLPSQTARMLVAHYIEESSHAEIAEKMGLKTGAVAVRLQRGKRTLQRLLRTQLQAEALAFDLLPREAPAWEETNIWCTSCGQRRLLGQFQRGTADARFVLRCPNCHPEPGTIMVGHDLTLPYYAALLGSTKTYKPAYTRLVNGLAPYYHQALRSNTAACLACGKPAVARVTRSRKQGDSAGQEGSEILIHCLACGWASNMALSGLVLALPEAQRFWREYPRMRALPAEIVETQGLPAYVTRLQSVSGASELAVITRRDTLALIAVHASTTF